MSDEELETPEGISRRGLIKRGAIVGGTVMWAAPVVSSFTSPAFGQTEPSPGETNISYIAFNITCGTQIYRVKLGVNNQQDGSTSFSCDSGTTFQVPGCEDTTNTALVNSEGGCSSIQSHTVVGDDVRVTLVAGCVFSGTASLVKCGQACETVVMPIVPTDDFTFQGCATVQP